MFDSDPQEEHDEGQDEIDRSNKSLNAGKSNENLIGNQKNKIGID